MWLIGLMSVSGGLTSACGHTVGSNPLGLLACGEGGIAAAFWANDAGIGAPGSGPEAPAGGDVWAIDGGGGLQRLTDDERSLDPALGPRGATLYFARSSGELVGEAAAIGSELWRRDLASGDERMLYSMRGIRHPEASPDGTMVAFDAPVAGSGGDYVGQRVFVVDADTGELTAMLPMPAMTGFQSASEPAWSSDSSSVSYLNTSIDTQDRQVDSVVTVDLSTESATIQYQSPEGVTLRGLDYAREGFLLVTTLEQHTDPDPQVEPGHESIEIELGTEQTTTVAEKVSFDTSYVDDDGSVAEIGVIAGADSLSAPPVLAIWRSGIRELIDLPINLAFAGQLDVVRC
jgi:hypothetical protein